MKYERCLSSDAECFFIRLHVTLCEANNDETASVTLFDSSGKGSFGEKLFSLLMADGNSLTHMCLPQSPLRDVDQCVS